MKEQGYTDLAPAPMGPYSQGCKAAGFIFVSGQGPIDPATGRLFGNDIAGQTRQTLLNIQHILESMRATMKDVVKTTVIITDAKDFAAVNEVYKEFFSEPYPTRMTYGTVLTVPGMKVEMDAIAYVGK